MENNLFLGSFPSLSALPIKKNFKLKVFAMLSTRKDIPEESIKEKMLMTLTVAYDRPTAELAVLQGMQVAGLAPADYNLTRMIIERDLEQLVDFGSIWQPDRQQEKEFRIAKGKQEMIAYIKYVFDKAGTSEEKDISENVIKKYNQIKNA